MITNLETIVLDANFKKLNKESFWFFYPENILQSFFLCKEVEYLEFIILGFQINSNAYLN